MTEPQPDDEIDDFQRIGQEYAKLLRDIVDTLGWTMDEAAAFLANMAHKGWTWEREPAVGS